jgi:hypothetical protein
MRGYGSWSIGWNEAERNPTPPPGDNWGCGLLSIAFIIIVICTSLKTSVETGNVFALIIGLAIAGGVFQGLFR